jgi:hypothetical protein
MRFAFGVGDSWQAAAHRAAAMVFCRNTLSGCVPAQVNHPPVRPFGFAL